MIIVKILGTFQDIGECFDDICLNYELFSMMNVFFHKVLLTDLVTDRTDYRDAIASKKRQYSKKNPLFL